MNPCSNLYTQLKRKKVRKKVVQKFKFGLGYEQHCSIHHLQKDSMTQWQNLEDMEVFLNLQDEGGGQ